MEEEKKEKRALQIILYLFPHSTVISIGRLILRRYRNDRRTLIRSDPSNLARSGRLSRPSIEQEHSNPATTPFSHYCYVLARSRDDYRRERSGVCEGTRGNRPGHAIHQTLPSGNNAGQLNSSCQAMTGNAITLYVLYIEILYHLFVIRKFIKFIPSVS